MKKGKQSVVISPIQINAFADTTPNTKPDIQCYTESRDNSKFQGEIPSQFVVNIHP